MLFKQSCKFTANIFTLLIGFCLVTNIFARSYNHPIVPVSIRYIVGTAFLARVCAPSYEPGHKPKRFVCGGTYGVGYSHTWWVPVGSTIDIRVRVIPGASPSHCYLKVNSEGEGSYIHLWGTSINVQKNTSNNIDGECNLA